MTLTQILSRLSNPVYQTLSKFLVLSGETSQDIDKILRSKNELSENLKRRKMEGDPPPSTKKKKKSAPPPKQPPVTVEARVYANVFLEPKLGYRYK